MEKVFIIFAQRIQYKGLKLVADSETIIPKFYESEGEAQNGIDQIIGNLTDLGARKVGINSIESKDGNLVYRWRVRELVKG